MDCSIYDNVVLLMCIELILENEIKCCVLVVFDKIGLFDKVCCLLS